MKKVKREDFVFWKGKKEDNLKTEIFIFKIYFLSLSNLFNFGIFIYYFLLGIKKSKLFNNFN